MDHKMLTHHIPAAILQMAVNPKAPEAPPPKAKQLHYPVTKEALLATKDAIDAKLTTKIAQTAEQINEACESATSMMEGRDPTATVIQEIRDALSPQVDITEMAENLMVHLQQAYDIMLNTCPNKAPYTQMYMTRTVGREYEKLNTQIIELKRIRQETNNKIKRPQCTYTEPTTTTAKEMLAALPT